MQKGDKISVYSNLQQGQSGSAMVFVDVLNQDVFEEGYNKLSKSVMTTTKLTGSSMEGTINAQENGLFYTSVPYEEGWKAYVDGKEVKLLLSAMHSLHSILPRASIQSSLSIIQRDLQWA